jgi:hypothetical protein
LQTLQFLFDQRKADWQFTLPNLPENFSVICHDVCVKDSANFRLNFSFCGKSSCRSVVVNNEHLICWLLVFYSSPLRSCCALYWCIIEITKKLSK